MKRLFAVAAILLLASCAAIGDAFMPAKPGEDPAALQARRAEVLAQAAKVAADAAVAATAGTPWGVIIGSVAAAASTILGGLHVSNRNKISKALAPKPISA